MGYLLTPLQTEVLGNRRLTDGDHGCARCIPVGQSSHVGDTLTDTTLGPTQKHTDSDEDPQRGR